MDRRRQPPGVAKPAEPDEHPMAYLAKLSFPELIEELNRDNDPDWARTVVLKRALYLIDERLTALEKARDGSK